MKKAISIFRIAILALMGSVGVLFLLGEEQDETVLSFFLQFPLRQGVWPCHACRNVCALLALVQDRQLAQSH